MNILGLNPSSIFSKNVAGDLLWGCWCKGNRIAGVQFPPLPLLYVGTVLKNEGHKVDIVDVQIEGMSREKLRDIIVNYDIVFLISATMSYKEDADLLTSLKEKTPQLITIVFGAHPTFLLESALTRASVYIIVKKEAEFVIRDLVREFEKHSDGWKRGPGIGGYREDGKIIIINQDYPYIDNLDELPIPDRAFLPKDVFYYNPYD